MPEPRQLPSVGTVIGKYRLDRVVGEGGMGVVFEATHVRLGQRVAIKMLLPALVAVGELFTRFEREGRAAARLRHRNSARVIDVDQTEAGIPYIVMELLHGRDLESELEARGALPVGEAVHFVLQAAAAMVEAHANGTIHRDLKPSNLFLNDEADGSVCLKVLDFGISKVTSDDVRVTSTETQMGTPLYMSPEQVRSAKHVDGRTDIWSLGAIAYELLTGKPPFEGSAAGIGAAIVSDQPTPISELRPEVPEGLARVIARAMEKDPNARFASMQELADALAPFSSAPVAIASVARVPVGVTGRTSSPSMVSAPTVAAQSDVRGTAGNWTKSAASPRPRMGIWVVLAAVVLLGGVGAYFAVRSRAPAPAAVAVPESAPSTPTPSASKEPKESTSATVVQTASSPPSASSVTTKPTAPRPTAKPKPSANPDRL